ncbi:MAG: sigma-70 family RNA polymerase sigma factor [Micropruina sp.]|uniref:RNA polymerase sigma factor n=1 Tax=Micropruina sp. TaxID=2737536 RepID=UPI0039E2DD93
MSLTSTEFEQLYREHSGEILGYLTRRAGTTDAPDLLADTFLTAWRRRDVLPAPAMRRAWLFGTARNLLLAHHRDNPPRPVEHPEPGQPIRPDAAPDAQTERQLERAVHAVLAELAEVDRELLTMTAWERLSVADAGRALGLTSAAARVRLHRLRRRLALDPRLADLVPPPSEREDRAEQASGGGRSGTRLRPPQRFSSRLVASE